MTNQTEMPRYQSHKTVGALEIDRVEDNSHGELTMHFRDPGFAPRLVSGDLFARYMPEPGDFFIVYADGYESVSPRQAFLDGYSRL